MIEMEKYLKDCENRRIKNNIQVLQKCKKEILSKTNLFRADKSVIELVFEKHIKQLKDKLL